MSRQKMKRTKEGDGITLVVGTQVSVLDVKDRRVLRDFLLFRSVSDINTSKSLRHTPLLRSPSVSGSTRFRPQLPKKNPFSLRNLFWDLKNAICA